MSIIYKEFDFFTLLPPELRVVFNISLTMDQEAFLEYTEKMDLEKKDQLFFYLPMALMYKNHKMVELIYDIVERSGYQIGQDTFKMQIERINNDVEVIDRQAGGGEIKKYLYRIGIIIFACFYDYYIITNGSWDRLSSSIADVKDISLRIQEGCDMEYRPSKTISLLARVTKDPSFIYGLEYAMQCISTPTMLSEKLQSREIKNFSHKALNEMQKKIKALPKFPELPKPNEAGTQLVPFGKSPEEIEDFLNEKLLILNNNDNKVSLHNEDWIEQVNLDYTINRFKSLAKMSSNEFKIVFDFQKEQFAPVPSPTQAPTMQHMVSFASDLLGVFTELAPTTFSPSFSFKNVFLWALQDTIRDTIRKIEDQQIKSQRGIQDFITYANRVFSDISSLPQIITFLFFLNVAALRSFVFFAKKIMGKKREVLKIKDSGSEVEELEKYVQEFGGSYIRRKKQISRKLRTRKHNKRKQSKSKKNRRITRRR
jgi:hypothetical protein